MLPHIGNLFAKREMTNPSCSVVVCTRDRIEPLQQCLGSLSALDHSSYEVIVVDNSAGSGKVEQIAERSGARYLVEPRAGLSRARNTGARAALGGLVAFIDDDSVAEPEWLSRHAEALADPSLAATTGRILPIAPGAEPADTLPTSTDDFGPEPFRVDRRNEQWFEIANFGGIGRGGNIVIRRALFEGGWGFREDLGLPRAVLGEEHYAFFQLLRRGKAIAYVPDAVVRHTGSGATREVNRRRRRALRSSSAYMLMLLVEKPEFRRTTLRYAWQALRGRRPEWRRGSAQSQAATRTELLAAACTGPWLYLRNRLKRR